MIAQRRVKILLIRSVLTLKVSIYDYGCNSSFARLFGEKTRHSYQIQINLLFWKTRVCLNLIYLLSMAIGMARHENHQLVTINPAKWHLG